MKAIFTLVFFLVISSTYGQVYLREKDAYKQDSLKKAAAANEKIDTANFKMSVNPVNMSMDKYFNTDLSDLERQKRQAAITFFDNQIKADSTNLSAYMNRGAYYAELGLHVQAIKDFNKALTIEANQPIVYYNRAISKARFMYTLDACKDLKKAGELGYEPALTLMTLRCGRYTVELSASPQSASK
ncbi:MAG: hypothetical protein NT150_01545 [Bacteroidetes bacterium]|nr:hypothetical protein [Bacteroidota bacterium]